MAVTTNRIRQTAAAAARLSGEVRAVQAKLASFLKYNSAQEIDWYGLSEELMPRDADGNMQGFDFSAAEVGNAIGTFEQHRKLFNNEQVTESKGDHIGNMNKLASPLDS